MKRRRTGGGGFFQHTLRRRLEYCKSSFSTAEEIVYDLRRKYPDYQRTKYQTLIRLVHDALHSTRNENHDDMEGPSVSRVNMDEEEEEEDDDDSKKSEATLHNPSTSCDSGSIPSAIESNGTVSEEDRAKEVKVRNKGFKDLGGMKEIFEELKTDLVLLRSPELARELGVKPIGGILLHGLPGCGKTRLAHAIAYELGFNFYPQSATELVSGVSGASEENIRELFSKAKRTAPSIIFIDEIDTIATKRENLQRHMETRIVTQLMICMDEVNGDLHTSDSDEPSRHVLVIGATNRPNAIEPALRRPGRFDREILIGIPNESSREEILTAVTCIQKHDGSIDLRKIARSTPGYVGADLAALANMAGHMAARRINDEREHKLSQDLNSEPEEDLLKQSWLPQDLKRCAITMSDFEEAAKIVQPSLRRVGFSPIPNVKWEDVGALDLVRQEFYIYILRRIKYPEDYEGMNLDTGFLLYGPPGCGKTLIAKAVANEAGAPFIHVKGPELLDKYVGQSESEVRRIFSCARSCAPCIIFFDEVDALTTERGKEGARVIEGVLNQLLIELDGAEQRKGVFVIGATNRPEVMDRAVLRPGRFGKLLYVPLPSPDDRVKILKALAKDKPIDASVDLSAIGRMKDCENFSGADLAALMNEADMAARMEKWNSAEKSESGGTIKPSHFEVALSKVSPSVSAMQRQYYQRISEFLKAA